MLKERLYFSMNPIYINISFLHLWYTAGLYLKIEHVALHRGSPSYCPDYTLHNSTQTDHRKHSRPQSMPKDNRKQAPSIRTHESLISLTVKNDTKPTPPYRLRSKDEEYAALFVTKTAKAITVKPECWKNLSTMARRAAQESVGRMVGAGGHDDARVHLTSLIQILTMRVILCVKFGMNVERVPAYPDTCLVDLATAINDTWVASKTADAKSEMSAFKDNHRLQTCLRRIFQSWSGPRENPLNLILPGFETMWRVALRAFLEVRYGAGSEWRGALAAFGENPTTMQFLNRDGEGGCFC